VMTTVASASRSPSIKRPQYPTAGSSQPDQNYPNSITPTEEPTFSTLSVISAVSGVRQACPLAAQLYQTGYREMSIIDGEYLCC
jgi:hypothetical protein